MIDQNCPRATCESLGIKITAHVPEAEAEAVATIALIDEYLSGFAAPTGKCLKCGVPTSGLMGALLGGMEWGIVHGELRCRTCKWPGRGYHDINDECGGKLFERPLQFVLQYHPSVVSAPREQLEAIAASHSDDPVLANIEQGVRDGLSKADATAAKLEEADHVCTGKPPF